MAQTVAAATAPVAPALLPAEATMVDTVAKFFRALGDPTRLRLLEFLLEAEHTVSECVAKVGLSQGRVSVHLACLADCGYVTSRRAGRNAFYRVADPRVADLVVLAHALAECQRIAPPPPIDPDPLHHRDAQPKPEGPLGQP
jgi:DNA-binding transcriptional ArsR family regulator